MKTIHDNERDHIITVLKKCNGKIWGPGGAAEILKVPPSTLQSKMKKLDILKENY
jgi:transcriptional regulator with GAF, ATPase, and Fis domain